MGIIRFIIPVVILVLISVLSGYKFAWYESLGIFVAYGFVEAMITSKRY